jgi:hypothetical protein
LFVLGFEFSESLLILFYENLNRRKELENVGDLRRKIILICLHF